MRDRQVYWALGATLALFAWLVITMLFYIPSPAKVIITVIVTIVCVGVVFASVVLMNLKRNPKAYNWMDPDLKLTRLEEKKKSKDGYYYYEPKWFSR